MKRTVAASGPSDSVIEFELVPGDLGVTDDTSLTEKEFSNTLIDIDLLPTLDAGEYIRPVEREFLHNIP